MEPFVIEELTTPDDPVPFTCLPVCCSASAAEDDDARTVEHDEQDRSEE